MKGAAMRFLSVCSGLEGASLALDRLGWTASGFAEIEGFPSAIIAERFGSNLPGEIPSANAPPNFGDFTAIDLATLGPVELLIGGTPCQAFSIAGKRLSLADARGNLTLAYVVLAHELARSHGLRNAIWENVPGVLNTTDNAFGCFLGAIVGHDSAFPQPHGAGWPSSGMADGPRARCAWRLLDAQYFGLAQRRERVFVVADFGNGADPAAVLFERQGLQGNSAPSRETRQGIAKPIAAGSRSSGGYRNDADTADNLIAKALLAHPTRGDFESETFVCAPPLTSNPYGDHESREGLLIAHSLRAEGFDASEDGTGRGTPLVPIAFRTSPNVGAWETGGRIDALTTGTDRTQHVVAFQDRFRGDDGRGYDRPPPISIEQTGALETVKPWAVAFDMRGREGGAMPEGPHDTANIRAASGGSSRSYVAQAFGITADAIDRSGESASGTAADRCGLGILEEQSPTLRAKRPNVVATQWAVRRLTPTECERLQGVPDGHTRIPWRGKPADQCPDGPRYKALGNSWAVPVVAWIARRLTDTLSSA